MQDLPRTQRGSVTARLRVRPRVGGAARTSRHLTWTPRVCFGKPGPVRTYSLTGSLGSLSSPRTATRRTCTDCTTLHL